MYRISEMAMKVGLSRSTLLYYEKIGLISSKRQANGYRVYSDNDLQQLKLLQRLQAGGLTLRECQVCLKTRIDRSLLLLRLQILDEEITEKQRARDLLASMLGMSSMRQWHQTLESQAPEVHLAWLMKQGFSEKQALRLKWLSKDMNEHEQYMADFERIFDGLDRLGPGSYEDSLKAFHALPFVPEKLLEIGCGRGVTATLLAEHTQGYIFALDNDEHNLSYLRDAVRTKNLQEWVTPVCASMTDMPFDEQHFDAIWSEGSAYIMGFEKALISWKPFIKTRGCLVLSDLVWLTDKPHDEPATFWRQSYSDMTTVKSRLSAIEALGYEVLDTFPLSLQAWENYLSPLREKVEELAQQDFSSNALTDIEKELRIHHQYLGEYGYQFFVLQKTS